MKTPYELAIEAGARAAERTFLQPSWHVNELASAIIDAAMPYAIPERCEQQDELWLTYVKNSNTVSGGLTAGLSHLRTRMTPLPKPVDPPKPPADDEQVERVARAIHEASDSEYEWDVVASAKGGHMRNTRFAQARAAIAAMGGGKRWGVWVTHISGSEGWQMTPSGRKFSTTDDDAALTMADVIRRQPSVRNAVVREYVEQPKAKTAEEIALLCMDQLPPVPVDRFEATKAKITAAIENARKEAACGDK